MATGSGKRSKTSAVKAPISFTVSYWSIKSFFEGVRVRIIYLAFSTIQYIK
jgi:hypothetical protein